MEEKLKSKLEKAGFIDPFTIMILINVAYQLIKILWKCRGGQRFVKNAAKRNGLAARLFLNNQVIPELLKGGMNQEQAESAADKLREMLAEGELDEFFTQES